MKIPIRGKKFFTAYNAHYPGSIGPGSRNCFRITYDDGDKEDMFPSTIKFHEQQQQDGDNFYLDGSSFSAFQNQLNISDEQISHIKTLFKPHLSAPYATASVPITNDSDSTTCHSDSETASSSSRKRKRKEKPACTI